MGGNLLVEKIREFFEDSSVRHVSLYGSKDHTVDIDILIVSDNPIPPGKVLIGKLDLINVSHESFLSLCKNFDLILIEPLFKGEHIFGDNDEWDALKSEILSTNWNREIVSYLLSKATEFYTDAIKFYECIDGTSQQHKLFASLTNISFSLSYFLAARLYSGNQGSGPHFIEYLQSVRDGELLEEIRQLLHNFKISKTILTAKNVREYIYALEEIWVGKN